MKFILAGIDLMPSDLGPDINPISINWKKTNRVETKEIPGKGHKDVTQRTSDKTLWICTLSLRSHKDERYNFFKKITDECGPFMVQSPHGDMEMYVIDGDATNKPGEGMPPKKDYTPGGGQYTLYVADWQIVLKEKND